jgi:hypothetical protein
MVPAYAGEVVRFSEIENFIWFDKQISDSTLRTLMHRTTSNLIIR